MKAISVRQPWAGLICLGLKDIENRSWRCRNAPQAVAIHAGKRMDDDLPGTLEHRRSLNPRGWHWGERLWNRVFADGFDDWRDHPAFACGAVVGAAVIVSCSNCHASRADAEREFWGDPGAYWWLLAYARVFAEPKPWRGRLGLFDVPDEIAYRAHFGVTPRRRGGSDGQGQQN
jgi:hypothetical protein